MLAVVTPMVGVDEGCRLTAYQDTRGLWTIGWGRHDASVCQGMTCTQAEADAWRDQAIENVLKELDGALPWWRGIDIVRASVMVDMAYELGLHGFLAFKNTIALIKRMAYVFAAHEMLNSEWALQVPNRARRLSRQLDMGVLQ